MVMCVGALFSSLSTSRKRSALGAKVGRRRRYTSNKEVLGLGGGSMMAAMSVV